MDKSKNWPSDKDRAFDRRRDVAHDFSTGPAAGQRTHSTLGSLYIVATPIGNLGDLSPRAIEILKTVDLIASEDTRHSGILLSHFGISTRQTPYHDFNKERVLDQLLDTLMGGKSIALVSDAGTPGIADPAYLLVRAAIENKIRVVPVPGPCAAIAALIASGMPTDRFVFENFPPRKKGKRRALLESLKDERRTVIFYESPYRIVALLEDVAGVFGRIPVVVARELTKTFEEFLRMDAKALLDHFAQHPPKGECVVIFNPRYAENQDGSREMGDGRSNTEEDIAEGPEVPGSQEE